jgi:hypothetical protein
VGPPTEPKFHKHHAQGTKIIKTLKNIEGYENVDRYDFEGTEIHQNKVNTSHRQSMASIKIWEGVRVFVTPKYSSSSLPLLFVDVTVPADIVVVVVAVVVRHDIGVAMWKGEVDLIEEVHGKHK